LVTGRAGWKEKKRGVAGRGGGRGLGAACSATTRFNTNTQAPPTLAQLARQ